MQEARSKKQEARLSFSIVYSILYSLFSHQITKPIKTNLQIFKSKKALFSAFFINISIVPIMLFRTVLLADTGLPVVLQKE